MLSAMGPQYQKYLWWKKYMTEIQIVSVKQNLPFSFKSPLNEDDDDKLRPNC
jgi:hypothetical protein